MNLKDEKIKRELLFYRKWYKVNQTYIKSKSGYLTDETRHFMRETELLKKFIETLKYLLDENKEL